MAQRADGRSVLLGDLVRGLIEVGEYGRLPVRGLSHDSRSLLAGELFVAFAGRRTHGMAFFDEAVRRGAVAVLAEPGGNWDRRRLAQLAATSPVPLFMVTDLGRRVGVIASRCFGQPGLGLRVVGITGTNGKTTVAHVLSQALAAQVATGMIGTLGCGLVGGELRDTAHTTPDAIHVQAELARQAEQGARAVAMEVSSHALDQGRVQAVPFHTVVFTNLTRDHLDYHGSMEAYGRAKAGLFRRPGLMEAVINVGDDFGADLFSEVVREMPVVACAAGGRLPRHADRFVLLREVTTHPNGLEIAFESSWGGACLRSGLFGRFNAENLMLVLGVLLSWGLPVHQVVEMLSRVGPVPGRMNLYGGGGRPRVVVDYAHTPDALGRALEALREHAAGRLICVFGCGGERDRGKRAGMGAVAERLADRVILTDDNPRGESPEAIVREIRSGLREPEAAVVEHDRAAAIERAVREAGPDDIVLVAGKGHENWQVVGEQRLPFSDAEQVQRALRECAA